MKNIGRNINTYDTTNAVVTQLNTATFVDILPEKSDRVGYKIDNSTAHDIQVKEQSFDDPDNTSDEGFPVFKRSLYESKPDNVPVGAISARAKTGTPTIKAIEE